MKGNPMPRVVETFDQLSLFDTAPTDPNAPAPSTPQPVDEPDEPDDGAEDGR